MRTNPSGPALPNHEVADKHPLRKFQPKPPRSRAMEYSLTIKVRASCLINTNAFNALVVLITVQFAVLNVDSAYQTTTFLYNLSGI